MASKDKIPKKKDVQARLKKLISSMESHLKRFKQWDTQLAGPDLVAWALTRVSGDIEDFEKFFETSDNSELKG